LLVAAAGARAGDEIGELVKEVNPPARFRDYKPDFALAQHSFGTWIIHDKKSPKYAHNKRAVTVITDRGRFVGQHQERCDLYLFYHAHPGFDVRPLYDWENMHFSRQCGSSIGLAPPKVSWKPMDYGADEEKTEFLGGGETIGWKTTWRWKPDGKAPGRTGEAIARSVLRVDPILGYVVDMELDWRVKPQPTTKPKAPPGTKPETLPDVPLTEVYNCLFSDGIANPWPDQATYAHFVYTPEEGAAYTGGAKYVIWANNGATIRRIKDGIGDWPKHCPARGNGFVGFLKNRHGWGLAETLTKGKMKASICPDYGEWHHFDAYDWKEEQDGFFRVHFTKRLVGLPPEIVEHIYKNAKDRSGAGGVIQIRLGRVEDFEDQPLPLSVPDHGIWYRPKAADTDQPMRSPHWIVTDRAHSGKKSVKVQGLPEAEVRSWVVDRECPPAKFKCGGAWYKLSCWIYVEGADTEAYANVKDQLNRENYLKYPGPGHGRTTPVTAGQDWVRVEDEFEARLDGGAVAIGFIVRGPGQAYFDDFELREIPAPAKKSEEELLKQEVR
jgi:hypothetical protein